MKTVLMKVRTRHITSIDPQGLWDKELGAFTDRHLNSQTLFCDFVTFIFLFFLSYTAFIKVDHKFLVCRNNGMMGIFVPISVLCERNLNDHLQPNIETHSLPCIQSAAWIYYVSCASDKQKGATNSTGQFSSAWSHWWQTLLCGRDGLHRSCSLQSVVCVCVYVKTYVCACSYGCTCVCAGLHLSFESVFCLCVCVLPQSGECPNLQIGHLPVSELRGQVCFFCTLSFILRIFMIYDLFMIYESWKLLSDVTASWKQWKNTCTQTIRQKTQ